jgi:hypothetical protein
LLFKNSSKFLRANDVLWERKNILSIDGLFYCSSKAALGQGIQHAVTDKCTSKTYCLFIWMLHLLQI